MITSREVRPLANSDTDRFKCAAFPYVVLIRSVALFMMGGCVNVRIIWGGGGGFESRFDGFFSNELILPDSRRP
jgi:hypothetical protein